ncbi:bifunctional diguanylate cyclase/phosphodiesterase [Oceanithermus sp.]
MKWIIVAIPALAASGLIGVGLIRRRYLLFLAGLAIAVLGLGFVLPEPLGGVIFGIGVLALVAVVARISRASRGRSLRLLLSPEGELLAGGGLEKMLGWKLREVRGSAFASLVYPEDYPLWEKALEQVSESGQETTLEFRAVHASGRLTWLRAFLEPAVGGVLLEAFEVTPYKLAEQTLRAQERLLKGVSEATRTMLAASDDLSWPLNKAIATLAMSLGAERAYIYRVREHEDTGRRRAELQVQWVRDTLKTQTDAPLTGELLESDPRFSRWFRELEHGQVIAGPVAQLPGEERLMLESAGVGSILLLPLLIGGRFWGFAGFELSESGRRFGRETIKVLRTAAASLAAGIERVERTRELRVQRSLLERINEAAGDGILAVDASWRPLFFNRRFLEIWELSEEELQSADGPGLSLLTSHTSDPERFAEVLLELHENPNRTMHLELSLKDGRIIEVSSSPLTGSEAPGGRVWFMRDVTESRRLQKALARSEERFRTILQNSSDITCVLDQKLRVRYISPAVEEVLGYEARRLAGLPVTRAIHPEDRERLRRAVAAVMEDPKLQLHVSFRIFSAKGEVRWLEARGRNLLTNPAIRGLLVSARDITEHKVYEAQVEQMAFYDALTGLANRRLLRERVEEAIAGGSQGFAFIYIDLDRFKNVNDTLGHDVGDALLVQVAKRLSGEAGEGDVLARLGGDEFAVLARRQDEESVLELAQRLVHSLRPPFEIDEHRIHVSGSAGIALYPQDGATFEQLLRHADIAMYRAKDDGTTLRFYSPKLNIYTQERFQLETDLRSALHSGNLTLYYQPIQSVSTGRIKGLEALVRWEHPDRGQIFPEEFLPIIEEAGLAVSFDRQILTQAVRQVSHWRSASEHLWVSVNISHDSLRDPEFIGFLKDLLTAENVPPEQLLIEVTESQASRDPESTKVVLAELKNLGVRLALDDFGRGYSSLSYISDFPIDLIKIDRSFIRGIPFRTKDSGIVRMIIALANQMGIEVLAEGVETDTQREWLQAAGVHFLQGYAISEALPPSELPFEQVG